jgi:tripartite-type tricarboxylate transporter receptor subunit TctC
VIRRRALLAGAAALAAASGPVLPLQAITLLIGAKAGSASDEIARAFAPFLERHLPYTRLEVRNVPGEAGLAAYRAIADADPAGGIVGWVVTPNLPARMVDRRGGALMKRIRLLGAVQREPVALVGNADNPPGSVREALHRVAADAEASPFGTPSAGSPPHLLALRLQEVSRMKLNIVPFPSAAAARQAAIAGNVAAAALELSDATANLRDGKLAGLAIADRNRSGLFPDIPTLHESGLDVSAWIRRGLAAPAQVPDPVAGQLIHAMREVAADPDFASQADSDGFTVAWEDGASWAAKATVEREELARLWQEAPWLPAANG